MGLSGINKPNFRTGGKGPTSSSGPRSNKRRIQEKRDKAYASVGSMAQEIESIHAQLGLAGLSPAKTYRSKRGNVGAYWLFGGTYRIPRERWDSTLRRARRYYQTYKKIQEGVKQGIDVTGMTADEAVRAIKQHHVRAEEREKRRLYMIEYHAAARRNHEETRQREERIRQERQRLISLYSQYTGFDPNTPFDKLQEHGEAAKKEHERLYGTEESRNDRWQLSDLLRDMVLTYG